MPAEDIKKIDPNTIEVTGEAPKTRYTKSQVQQHISLHEARLVIEKARLEAFDWEIP